MPHCKYFDKDRRQDNEEADQSAAGNRHHESRLPSRDKDKSKVNNKVDIPVIRILQREKQMLLNIVEVIAKVKYIGTV
ncbi:hypothetical protein HMPREF0663_12176 [Hoylesella oralis ATCC 33269]|uniref:Uncharacterized protein n=1 Tax=Hoylesella oralis ATCC 33269 TaxID=873533 RepID=E7RSA8_9BACT|nr:hypothetical protein HMPREF0663_12176 [Hoylesella oralis ATCC 33269]EPH19420.1 hypothetical protein HMPREF1475_00310 [Hoylesella oralis HGA0225]SHG04608.1 hypothetical protein SAMN05444288_2225 [Hoylesella oralis]